jgi:hypothetical protein
MDDGILHGKPFGIPLVKGISHNANSLKILFIRNPFTRVFVLFKT